jgi:hypothetical protein
MTEEGAGGVQGKQGTEGLRLWVTLMHPMKEI